MKVVVDLDACEGNAVCEQVAPELFRLEGDQAIVLTDQLDPTLLAKAQAAAEGCPRAAIRIEIQE